MRGFGLFYLSSVLFQIEVQLYKLMNCWITLKWYAPCAQMNVCVFSAVGVTVIGQSVKSMCVCVQTFISLLHESWRRNAYTLDTLFLSVISQLDGLQWKQYDGWDGNLFTHIFRFLEQQGSPQCAAVRGKPLSTYSKLITKPYFQFKNCGCLGATP